MYIEFFSLFRIREALEIFPAIAKGDVIAAQAAPLQREPFARLSPNTNSFMEFLNLS
jgi:hypothetical protein